MDPERIFDHLRYELATEPQQVTLDVYDDGRMILWVGEYHAQLSVEDRRWLADLLQGAQK